MNPLEKALKSQIPEPILNAATAITEMWENSDVKKAFDETGNTGVIRITAGNLDIRFIVSKIETIEAPQETTESQPEASE